MIDVITSNQSKSIISIVLGQGCDRNGQGVSDEGNMDNRASVTVVSDACNRLLTIGSRD